MFSLVAVALLFTMCKNAGSSSGSADAAEGTTKQTDSVAYVGADGKLVIPEHPTMAVNDYAGVLGDSVRGLEDDLRMYAAQTPAQIAVVTITNIGDADALKIATEIGDRWGVGQKMIDNGIVILIKPKTRFSKGQVFIATGRGLEGALPDVFCNRIVEDKMIPILKEGNNYTAATWAALKVIMPVCRGEYDYETYQSDEDLSLFDWICVIAILLVFIGFRIFLPFGGGSFTSGFSGSSGGFGGFGGGSFGGGGAGGSW